MGNISASIFTFPVLCFVAFFSASWSNSATRQLFLVKTNIFPPIRRDEKKLLRQIRSSKNNFLSKMKRATFAGAQLVSAFKNMLSLLSLGFTCFLSAANLSEAVLLVPGLGPAGPLEKEEVTKKPEINNDGTPLPCCRKQEHSPTQGEGAFLTAQVYGALENWY